MAGQLANWLDSTMLRWPPAQVRLGCTQVKSYKRLRNNSISLARPFTHREANLLGLADGCSQMDGWMGEAQESAAAAGRIEEPADCPPLRVSMLPGGRMRPPSACLAVLVGLSVCLPACLGGI